MLLRLSLLSCLALCGCGVRFGGDPLVSAQSPPGTGAVNAASEPQPLNSLPPGAANVGPGGPFVAQPNYGSITFGTR